MASRLLGGFFSKGPHKNFVGSLRSLGCFLKWFFPSSPVFENPIWSARFVKQRRVKGIRKCWKHRFHERCRALPHTLRSGRSAAVSQPSLSENRFVHNHTRLGLGLPDVSLGHLGACRGGARGNIVGKSNISGMEHELLNGLQKLLQQFNSQNSGEKIVKGKGLELVRPPMLEGKPPSLVRYGCWSSSGT